MTIANIISAIGNNSSVYPLIVRDCGIEVPSKIVLTYNQNKKESDGVAYLAARERFLDEYATSAVWLGGIPLVSKIADYLINKKGFCPDVNLKLFKEDNFQGIDYNINKFKNLTPDAVKDLLKVKENKKLYEKLLAGKFIASTTIPILFMGFILPKMIFASSAKKIEALRQKEKSQMDFVEKDKFFTPSPEFVNSQSLLTNSTFSLKGRGKQTFTGSWITKAANFSAQDKMAVTDGGYAFGRVITARNKNETMDISFKMAGMMFLNFVAPKWIEKGLNKLTGIVLDPVMLADKRFVVQAKNGMLELPKSDKASDLFEFIDNPANKNTMFVKYAKKFKKIKMLDNGIRDPRAYVNVQNLGQFRNDIEAFETSLKGLSREAYKSVVKKARFAKTANILTNVGLSSFLLAYMLPKAQFAFRKIVTGSDLEPGLAPAEKIVDNKKDLI